MKLLCDQNTSFRVIKKIAEIFTGAEQVTSVGLTNSSDMEIREYARKNGFCIVTFDADFMDLSLLKGFPPKIVWLHTGNISTDELAGLIMLNEKVIKEFLFDDESGFLELTSGMNQ